MTGNPHPPHPTKPAINTFQAIVRSASPRTVSISVEEYALIQEIRNMLEKRNNHPIQIGYRDGKFWIYSVSLCTTLTAGK